MEFIAELHPKVVHFPVALLITYTLFEILGAFLKREFISKAALVILFLGIITAVLAVLTGNQADQLARSLAEKGAAYPKDLIEQHELFATLTIWYFFALMILRTYFVIKKKFENKVKYLFAVLAIIGSVFVYKAGDYGGELVYKHGIGTDLIKPE